nr:immunoglobulin light chain junction region [Macaca mulatta]
CQPFKNYLSVPF